MFGMTWKHGHSCNKAIPDGKPSERLSATDYQAILTAEASASPLRPQSALTG